ncbi:hypothetical protein LS71_008390 [Helicobacter jaachi]|uniref:TrbI/VirB10 family protein n=1 Tax=Helicobacter jaachi TaxID=1677920 RepID=A0A4U8T7C9_9HELI|nr:hypothetical protein LS71_008390 [Helicobacter jaachi]
MIAASLIDEDEEWAEMNTKFPLEDYLFSESRKKLEQYEQKIKEQQQEAQKMRQMQEELQKMQEEMKKQQEEIKRKNKRVFRDKEGNVIELDENGNPILYDKDSKRIYFDESGKPYTLDEKEQKNYLSAEDKIFSKAGVEIERNQAGELVLYEDEKDKNEQEAYKDENSPKIAITTIPAQNQKGDSSSWQGNNKDSTNTKNPNKFKNPNKTYSTSTDPSKPVPPEEQNPDFLYDENGYYIGDSVAKENQKFIYENADESQRKINDILASRFNQDEPPKKDTEYGVDEFSNFDEKDEASNEHKLLRTITADRMIPAFLVRPISSQIAGNVVAQVETNIYGAMGRAVLIPKGSRVIGFYESNNKIGEYRLQVVWTRIITPHGVNILLTEAKSADVKGYNGLVGEVHSRNFERYGIPLTLSTLSNGLLLYVNSKSSQLNNAQSSGNANADLMGLYAQSQIMSGMRQDISGIIQRIIQEQIKIQPIITIREGSRIFIAPSQDIFIPVPKKGEAVARFFRQKKQQEEDSDE